MVPLLRRAGLLALALALATRARDAPRPLASTVEAKDGRLLATLDLAPAFPQDLKRVLSNGLSNVIVLHVALVPEHGDEPVALYGREVDVLYDVWEESYTVTVKDPSNPRGLSRSFRDYEELHAFLAEARAIDLGSAAELGSKSWVLRTRIELNPVSRELLDRTREFIANPAAGGRGGAPSRSVLGAMASYLLRGAEPGAEVARFESAPFTAREVSTP
ncbi:MAG TPA: hypothetical protein VMG32_14590 [Anaeromyxobacteraceae bacterium]|nr:hypothetical protein [Anaeromyxobacteraceae bacterium]